MPRPSECYVSPADAWRLSQDGCSQSEIAEYASAPAGHAWLETIASASADPWWRPIGWDS